MGFEKEKRKNDERRRGFLPVWAWTLIIGFVLGVVFMILVLMSARVETVAYTTGDSLTVNDEALYATATYIIEQATQQAQAAGYNATATSIVEQATATQAAIDAAKP
jgi:hypothetical protein